MGESSHEETDATIEAIAVRARAQLQGGRADQGGTVELEEAATRALLGSLLPFGPAIESETPEQAAEAAREFEGETVVKAIVPGLLHKSELGLVSEPCRGPSEVARSAELLLRRAGDAGLSGAILSVQERLEGVEIAVGLRQTELGPTCAVAAGGTLVELIDDAALVMAPVSPEQAREAILSLRAAALLDGYRDNAPADFASLVEVVVRVARLAVGVPEIQELDLNPVFVSEPGALAADARCVLAEPMPRESASCPDGKRSALRSLFSPASIAVIGASQDQRKVGGLIPRYLRSHEWEGELVAVNANGVAVDGARSARSVSELKPPPDLACIAVPADAVATVISECVEAGVKSGVVYASGFAETGEAGSEKQRELVDAARGRFHFVGPNSIGIASLSARLTASFAMGFESEQLPEGPIAFASQSGAIASALVSRADEAGVGFSHWVSTGNEADIGIAECVDYFAEAPGAEIICLFVESIRKPAAFRAACRRASAAGRPVVALIAGRSDPGRKAAATHTGAITSAAPLYDAFLKECGVITVTTLPGLFVAAKALLAAGPVEGRRLGVISMSGGACSLLADQAVERGLEVPRLSMNVQAELREILPAFGAIGNPIDITAVGIGSPDLVCRALNVVRRSGEVDLVAVQLSTNADPAADAIAADLIRARGEYGARFLIGRLGSPAIAPAGVARYRAAGVPVFTWPDELAEAARACVVAGETRRREAADVSTRVDPRSKLRRTGCPHL